MLALHFMGRNFSGFAEIFKDDIASARVAAKGFNMVIEVVDCNGQVITAVGPKKRLRSIFMQLGYPCRSTLSLWGGQAIRPSERPRSVLVPPSVAGARPEPRSTAMRAETPASTGVTLTSRCSSTAAG
ncbi:hypothetical protein [Nocardioides sambongensis]|uniref:hypothetical protein n=1 Tax=Nocardioides sambongensis TaxID=2589074 RepID=UPI001E436E50|nr:hypothetical protein [Nocardioides sambongensis]